MSEGPLERIRHAGVKGADAVSLLAVVLAQDESDLGATEERARLLLKQRNLAGLVDLARADFAELSNLDDFRVLQFQCAIALGRKIGMAGSMQNRELVRSPEDAAQYFLDLAEEPREHFCALFLDSKGGVISRKTIHIGTLNMSLVGVREVFREAVRENACSVIVAHNHPSGDPTPSAEDYEVTERLAEAGKLLDIDLRDHIIMGRGSWRSFRREKWF